MNNPGSVNYEVIYGVGLLDDVHNYFPSLLYDHGRFQSLPQVFHYVRHQMNTRFNLFSYGAQRHASASSGQPQQEQQQPRVEPVPRPMSSVGFRHQQAPSTPRDEVLSSPLGLVGSIAPRDEVPRNDIVYSPIRQSSLTSANILMALLGIGGTNDTWNSFNTPVIVAPSIETISLNTRILTGITNTTCAICQDFIIASDTCRRLNPCQHTYHQVCIDQWFQRSVACPTCRHDIRDATPISPQLTAISAADLIDSITNVTASASALAAEIEGSYPGSSAADDEETDTELTL